VRRQLSNGKECLKRLFYRQRLQPWHFDDIQKGYDLDKVESEHARSATIVAPPCVSLCSYAKDQWGIPAERVRLAPYPFVPPEGFLQIQPREQGAVVGFVGRLERRKGIETLAMAIPIVCRAFPAVTFRFIGAPTLHRETQKPYDEWLKNRLAKFLKHMEFVGKVPLDQMADAYQALDLCVFPSLWENFPNVCLEAMSAGRAIIGSKQGGMVDMLNHGEAGLLVEPGDPHALAQQILTLLRSSELRTQYGSAARDRILNVYNEKTIGEKMEKVYAEAIEINKGLSADGNRSWLDAEAICG